MGSKSSSSMGYTVTNTGVENVRKIMIHDNPNHNIYVDKMYWNYKAVGSHRFIELFFKCRNCCFSKYVRMDKTSDGSKKIDYFSDSFNEKGWWWWEYVPKRTDFKDCIKYFDDARSGYHKLFNNCADFARYIWNRLDYLNLGDNLTIKYLKS